MRFTPRQLIAALVITLAAAASLPASPLSPPLGPVTSTPGPEPRTPISLSTTPGDADSLFRISQPGSYYLTGNITAVANKHGIEIASSNVTLDLNGFHLVGIPAMGNFDAINSSASTFNISISNGTVSNWGGDGISLSSLNSHVQNIQAFDNAVIGIRTTSNSTVFLCNARSNGSTGISVGSGCSVSFSTSHENANGFNSAFSCTFESCSAYQNAGNGFSLSSANSISNSAAGFNANIGFSISNGSHITNCTALANVDGIRANFGCSILNNNCNQNATGIRVVNSDNRIEGNHVTNGTTGLLVEGTRNLIIKNTAADNTTYWSIAANNVYGPIINRTTPASPAILGLSATSTLGSTDPNANFSH
jgi:parallel beta-helix repeat protein